MGAGGVAAVDHEAADVSGYDYAAFLAAVRRQRRTAPTGCWVCDVLEAGHARTLKRCERMSGGIVDAHHVVGKSTLKREFPRGAQASSAEGPWSPTPRAGRGRLLPAARDLDTLLMDPRNGILVRRYHHDQVESRMRVIPAASLPAETVAFAEELGLGWYLDKMDDRRT